MKNTCTPQFNAAALAGALVLTLSTQASEIGHFAPGVLNIRDFAMPEPGFYGVLYNYGYTALTYEIHGEKEDFALTPGQSLTLNWGVSQYLPLRKDQQLLLEVGPAGYSSWQVTEDSGRAANAVKDEVHGVGGQLGLAYVPWKAALNFHYFYEFAAQDRFQGQSIGLNFAIKF
jgi:hypothetical protein